MGVLFQNLGDLLVHPGNSLLSRPDFLLKGGGHLRQPGFGLDLGGQVPGVLDDLDDFSGCVDDRRVLGFQPEGFSVFINAFENPSVGNAGSQLFPEALIPI